MQRERRAQHPQQAIGPVSPPDAHPTLRARDARAIEAPDDLIHGSNPLVCEFDEKGNCIQINPCGVNSPATDDCLSEAEPRAWSSPIFVGHTGASVGAHGGGGLGATALAQARHQKR